MNAPRLTTGPQRIDRRIDTLVIHCSATPSGQWLGGKAPGQAGYETAPYVIDRWHGQRGFARTLGARNGWNWRLPHIGYHAVIDLDGVCWTGRHLNEIGAHAAGHNAHSVGICLVGGAERDARYTRGQWESLAEVVVQLATLLGVPLQPCGVGRLGMAGVCGHRDLSPDANKNGQVDPQEWLKTCPGFDVGAWLERGLSPLEEQLFLGAP